MERFKRIVVFIAGGYLLAFFALFVFSLCAVTTKPNEYTVIRQFGQVVRIHSNEDGNSGLSFKIPFIQNVTTIPNTMLIYDLPVSNVITSDKKTMIADCFALYKVNDPMLYIRTLNNSLVAAEGRIDANVYNSLKNTISKTSQDDVISGRDGALVQSIMANIGNDLDSYGIALLSVETKTLDLPESNKEAVFTRMIAERSQIAAGFTSDGDKAAKERRNEADKEASIAISNAEKKAAQIRAEAEAEYMKIMSDAYNDPDKAEFYRFVRALDAAKVSLQTGDILYLDENSPIASIFTNLN
ncbi:MAG: protease modulator HflC [Clostridia bacterium]|jgi:membrane protease subunit HflC|nr:protease modulator HflC [Clostridia bacterium]